MANRNLFRRLGLTPGPDIDAYAAAALDDTSLEDARRQLDDFGDRALVHDVARIQRACGLDQDELYFFRRDRTMLDTARNHDQLTRLDPHVAITELHEQASLDHQEQLVFVVVMMPMILALHHT